MKVKMILPAQAGAKSPYLRLIEYSFYPLLDLATLVGYLDPGDEIQIQADHLDTLDLDDKPDLVVIQVYVNNAKRAYQLADHYRNKNVWVCLGGLHVTECPNEAAQHADTILIGPGDEAWSQFLLDLKTWFPRRVYYSHKRAGRDISSIRQEFTKRLHGSSLV